MKKRYVLVMISIFLLFGIRIEMLMVENEKNELYLKWNENENFSLSWVHSVEKERWIEYFKLKEEEVVLIGTKFKTFGAGVPSNFRESEIKDGWVVVKDLNRKMSRLNIRASGNTEHELIYGDKTFVLSKKGESRRYLIKKKKISLAKYVYLKLRKL